MAITLEQIEKACADAKIKCELVRPSPDQLELFSRSHLKAWISAGRETREVTINEGESKESIVDTILENRFVIGYDAIWSAKHRRVEAILNPLGIPSSSALLDKLAVALPSATTFTEVAFGRERISVISVAGSKFCESIRIGPASDEIAVLCRRQRRMSLMFLGVSVASHDDALAVIESLGNSFLFQLDLSTHNALYLVSHHERARRTLRKTEILPVANPEPDLAYDKEALSLYWYARSARGMPLLEFLAFYQVLEYFFPLYANSRAQRSVHNLLVDPLFDRHSERAAAQVLSIANQMLGRQGFGEERAQLRATLEATVIPEEVVGFFRSDPDRLEFQSSKAATAISGKRITLDNPNIDVLNSVSDRVYDIRCRIVHSKAQDESRKPLLPFSAETSRLRYDIELVEYLVQKALVASGRPITPKVRALEKTS